MDGAVIAVQCNVGQEVQKGDVLLLLEAMKIEHSLIADIDGTVASVEVQVGEQVKSKQLLLSIAPKTE